MQLDRKKKLLLPSTCMDAYYKAELSGDKILTFLPTSNITTTICQKKQGTWIIVAPRNFNTKQCLLNRWVRLVANSCSDYCLRRVFIFIISCLDNSPGQQIGCVLEMQLDWKVRLQLPSTCMDAYNKAELSGDKIFSFLPTSSFNITICQKVKALGIS